jgi:exodeoxyribonuclease VII small subunit
VKATPRKTTLCFAETLAALEQIVAYLQGTELPLEKALSEFERGVQFAFFLNFLTLEDRTDRMSRNVGTELPLNPA